MPEKPASYATKARSRRRPRGGPPTDFSAPPQVRIYLDSDQFAPLEMIWQRACEPDAARRRSERDRLNRRRNWRPVRQSASVGSVIRFDVLSPPHGRDRDEAAEKEDDKRLPRSVRRRAGSREDRSTKHPPTPPRYSGPAHSRHGRGSASGRPSTYAATVKRSGPRLVTSTAPAGRSPGPAGHGVSGKLLRTLRLIRLHSRTRWRSRPDFRRQLSSKRGSRAISGSIPGSVADIKELPYPVLPRLLNGAERELAPLVFPAREDGSNPRICPHMPVPGICR